jgi:hypothetical protein
MPIELPLVTRREIVREYRPESAVTEASAIRGLRAKHVLSDGLTVEMRGVGGRLGGRLHVYSALNRDAARALRRHDLNLAVRLGKAAAALEQSPEMRRLASALATGGAVGSTAALARALSVPSVAKDVALLQRKHIEARTQIAKTLAPTVLAGRIAGLDATTVILKFPHHASPLTLPRLVADEAGVAALGAAVSAMWEILSGGRTLITIEPAVDNPELSAIDEPLADVYGTPWGRILSEADGLALGVTGNATVMIPVGIPDVP